MKNNKFTYNDLVKIDKDAPRKLFPKRVGVICGFTKIKNEKTAKEYYLKDEEWLYTVEFEDGSDILVPESFLEKYED